MFTGFNIEEIYTDLPNKTIYIKTTLDVDESTVDKSTVEVTNNEAKNIVNISPEVSGQFIKIIFQEWPVPNTEYLMKIQRGVKSIMGDDLPASLRRSIMFTSDISSLVNIIYPSNFQEVESPYFKWEEDPQGGEYINNYYIEVAEENAFYNIVKSTYVYNKTEVRLDSLSNGQFFVRIRTEKEENYGPWSEIITFKYKDRDIEEEVIEPVIEEPVELIDKPENGVTPEETLKLRFNCDINPEDVEIIVYRRTI